MSEDEKSGLKGAIVVLAGELARADAHRAALAEAGATIGASVSPKTTLLVAGPRSGAPLARAEALGLDVIDEAQLERLLEGASFDEVLGVPAPIGAPTSASEAGPASPSSPPMPTVIARPRDGTFRLCVEGKEVVAEEGPLVAGRKHGTWRTFHESGALDSEVGFVHGLREGAEVAFHPNGKMRAEGRNEEGTRRGQWDFFHESGALHQRLLYDDEGKTHGEYVWNQEDGSPRARGESFHGARHGRWTWWGEPQHEKVERGHVKGRTHGEELALYPGGGLAYRRGWDMGARHGPTEERWPSGAPKEESAWVHGWIEGERRTWDEQGNLTAESFVGGLPESVRGDAKLLKKVATRVIKAKDPGGKETAITNAVPYDRRGALLLHLWRTGAVDLATQPGLFEMAAHEAAHVSAEELLELLGRITSTENTYCPHLPGWPRDLDRLVMAVALRDPEALAGGLPKTASPAVRRGLGWVLARFGLDGKEAIGDCADELAQKYLEQGFEDRVLWPESGAIVERTLTDWKKGGERTEHFGRMLELLTTHDAWAAAVLRHSLRRAAARERVSLARAQDGLRLASEEQMVALLNEVGLDDSTARDIERALLEWRSDDGATLARIALAVTDTGLRKWPTVSAAIVKLAEEGAPIPDALVDALPLDSGSPTLSWADTAIQQLPFDDVKKDPAFQDAAIDFAASDAPAFPRADLLLRALRAMSEAQRHRAIVRQLETPYGKPNVAPYLHAVDDPALWRRALEAIEAADYGATETVALGLGNLPKSALPLLLDAWAATKDKDRRSAYARAILLLLARLADRGEDWDASYDAFVDFDPVRKDFQYPSVRPLLRKVVHRMPSDRAAQALLRSLDPSSPVIFARAFAFIGSHPTEAVLHAAFEGLLQLGGALPWEQKNELRAGLEGFWDGRRWGRWLLLNAPPEAAREALASAFGDDFVKAS